MHGPRRLLHDAAQHSSRRILKRTAAADICKTTRSRSSTSTGLKDRSPKMIVAVDETDQRYDKRVTLLRGKRLEQTLLGTSHRPIHLSRQSLAGAGQPRKQHASVVRAAAPSLAPAARGGGAG